MAILSFDCSITAQKCTEWLTLGISLVPDLPVWMGQNSGEGRCLPFSFCPYRERSGNPNYHRLATAEQYKKP